MIHSPRSSGAKRGRELRDQQLAATRPWNRARFAIASVVAVAAMVAAASVGPAALASGASHAASAASPLADWTQSGYNARHTDYNPSETVLTRANVGHLVRAFSTPLDPDELGEPIVVNGVVYISGSEAGNLQAIDGVTGAVDWTLENFCGSETSDPAFASGNIWVGISDPGLGGISTSGVGVHCITAGDFYSNPPVAGGGGVYDSGQNEELIAMDAVTAKVRWMMGADSAPYTGPFFGMPTLSANGSDLYVTRYSGNYGDPTYLVELNAVTGALIWSRDIGSVDGGDGCGGSIADAGSVLYVSGSCGLFAVSAATGTIEWQSSSSLGSNFGSPVIVGNLVIASADVAAPQGLAAFNATTGKLVWLNTKALNGSLTAANGVVYVDEGSSLVMLNSSTGAQLGMRQPPSGFQFDGGAIPVDGHIYIAAADSTNYSFQLIAYEP